MTVIEKYTLDRMRDRGLAVSFQCPHCQGTRLELKEDGLDPYEGIRCYKCKSLVVLDGLSLTVIKESISGAESS